MKRVYKEIPENISEILPFVVTDKKNIAKEIIAAPKCFFYDASALRKHAMIAETECLIQYISMQEGVVVITRTILMEMCKTDGKIWDELILYLKKLHEAGILVLLMYEEDIFETLFFCYSSTEINHCLKYAVRTCKSRIGAVEKVLHEHADLAKEVLTDHVNSDKMLAQRFFQSVRKNKIAEDNMGEELIVICVHMLSNIPDMIQYKYVMFTEDKGAVALLGKARLNSERILKKRMIAAMTTPKLLQEMKKQDIIKGVERINDILRTENHGDIVKVYCSEEYDLTPVLKSMTCSVLADKIETNKVHIYY